MTEIDFKNLMWYNQKNKYELQGEEFMKLFVARHGQTTWNAQNKVCGITDVELTEKGIEQAKKFKKSCRNKSNCC